MSLVIQSHVLVWLSKCIFKGPDMPLENARMLRNDINQSRVIRLLVISGREEAVCFQLPVSCLSSRPSTCAQFACLCPLLLLSNSLLVISSLGLCWSWSVFSIKYQLSRQERPLRDFFKLGRDCMLRPLKGGCYQIWHMLQKRLWC